MKLSYRSITTLLGRGATTKFRVKTPKGDVELSIKEQFTGPPGGANIDTTGRLVWPTAVPLLERIKAEYLNEKSSILPSMPMPILEIGAGCGVLGTGLASTGFFDVTLTDTDQSVDWLENNVELNRNLVGDNAKVASLNWGDEGDAAKLEATLKAPFELIGSRFLVMRLLFWPTQLVKTRTHFYLLQESILTSRWKRWNHAHQCHRQVDSIRYLFCL
jgi:hypothetical protein